MRCVMRVHRRPTLTVSTLLLRRCWNSTTAAAGPAGEATTNAGQASSKGVVLPGVDLARRAVQPSQEFPATWSTDEPLAPSDPRVLWRELYSLEEEKPYYQNIKTMEVRWEIPDGFVTRFPRLYESRGYRVDGNGAVFSTEATAGSTGAVGAALNAAAHAEPRAGGVKSLTLKQRMATYGAGGLLWYLIIHNISLACVFTALYVFRIDLIGMARSYGFDVKPAPEVETAERKRPPFWKTFVMSVILNKMLVPAHLLLTISTAPLLVHRLEPVAAKLFPMVRSFTQTLFGKGKAAVASPPKL